MVSILVWWLVLCVAGRSVVRAEIRYPVLAGRGEGSGGWEWDPIERGVPCVEWMAGAAGRKEDGLDGSARNPSAAAFVVEGVVLEKGSGDPLEGVSIVASGSKADAVESFSGEDGRYTLELASGAWTLIYSLPGFLSQKVHIDVRGASRDLGRLFLEPRPGRRPALIVREEPDRDINLEIITREEIERVPGTGGDPLKALESLPGVARSGFLNAALVVRGAEPANTVVQLDGHPLPFLFHFGFWKSVINPLMVERVRFYPGGMPSHYGNVLQAVVDVRTREAARDRWRGVADINMTDTSLYLSGPLKDDMTVSGAARFSYLSLLIMGGSALANQKAWLFPRYSDYQIKVDAKLFGGRFSALLFGASDRVSLGESLVEGDPEAEYRFDAWGIDPTTPYSSRFDHLHLRFRRILRPGFTLDSSTLVGVDRQASLIPIDDETALRLPALTWLERPVIGEQAHLRLRMSSTVEWSFGGEARYSSARLRDLTGLWAGEAEVAPIELKPVFLAALFGRLDREFFSSFRFMPELRAAGYFFNHKWEFSPEPRFTVRYAFAPRWTMKAAVGRYTQLPEERQYWSRGDPELPLMKGTQAAIGGEGAMKGGLRMEATLFLSRLHDLVFEDYDLVYQESDHGYYYQTVEVIGHGDGWGYGGEINVKLLPVGRVNGSLSYAYTRSLRERNEELIPGDYDQPHTLTVLAQCILPHRWRVSGRFRLGSGQPLTPQDGAWQPSEHQYVPLEGSLNSERKPLYHQLDLRFDRTILRNMWRMNFYLDIQNIYMARNPILELPNWNYTGVGSSIWLPIVPTLGLKGEF